MSGDFDGVDQSINLGTSVNLSGGNDGGSICGFFNPDVVGDSRLIDKSEGTGNSDQTLMLGIIGPGAVRGNIGGTACSGVVTIATGVWHFAAITYDGANVRCYHGNPKTGVLTEVDSTAKTGNVGTDARNCRIASTGFDTDSRNYNGRLTDLRIYNEGLSVNELKCILNQHGHDTVKRSLRYRLRIAEKISGTIGAGIVQNIGPVPLALGSGTNGPSWSNQEMGWMPQPL